MEIAKPGAVLGKKGGGAVVSQLVPNLKESVPPLPPPGSRVYPGLSGWRSGTTSLPLCGCEKVDVRPWGGGGGAWFQLWHDVCVQK